jgi:hypothetical protein
MKIPTPNNVADHLKDTKNIPVSFAESEEISEKISETDTTEMPLHLLPGEIQKAINAYHSALNYPKEYTAASMLFAASVAMGNTCRAVVKPGWEETAVIFLCMVGNPGIGKTAPLRSATEPLREIDADAYKEYRTLAAAYKANDKLPKDQKDHNMQPPVWRKYLLSDATPEALAAKHMDNLRGVGYCVDELIAWFKNFNRYTAGSEQETWLSIFSGIPLNIDRKTSDPIHIRHPFVSVAGTIQPGILPTMGGEERENNGFIDRLLFVFPEGIKKEYWSDNQLSPDIPALWSAVVNKLLSLTPGIAENGDEYAHKLKFTSEAQEIINTWQRKNTDRCNEDESYAGIGAKIEIYAIRLSLIMQGLFFAAEGHTMHGIGTKAVTAAIGFADYFAGQALKVRGAITGSDPEALLTEKQRGYYAVLPEAFTTREAVNIAKNLKINDSTARRFLKANVGKLFKKIAQGVWSKI